jgi:hypothetical protein
MFLLGTTSSPSNEHPHNQHIAAAFGSYDPIDLSETIPHRPVYNASHTVHQPCVTYSDTVPPSPNSGELPTGSIIVPPIVLHSLR